MRVTGCAGSGKTMLALEQARRWRSREDRRVLFVCFNRRLQQHLRELEKDSGIAFWTFHSLCVHLARKAKVPLTDYAAGEAPQSYFDDELPTALIDAAAELGPQFDALVVDEAQDLETHWLTALMSTLSDEESDPVWLFLDDNQNIYSQGLELPGGFAEFELTWNCRNTQAIHREVAKLYRGEVKPEAIGPEGRTPELHLVEDHVACVRGVLERLIAEEGVPQADIVILSSHALAKSDFAGGQLGPYALSDDPAKRKGILFSSIRAFKGLESPVVILTELEDLDDATREQQLYVGLSRARNHCVIVAPPAVQP
jgi:superfamily I DNA and RNA helicase